MPGNPCTIATRFRFMGEENKSDSTKWIVVATSVLGLVAALLVVGSRYFEFTKAKSDAEEAARKAEKARVEDRPKSSGDEFPRPPLPPKLPPPPVKDLLPPIAK
jgi:hypothetical protein